MRLSSANKSADEYVRRPFEEREELQRVSPVTSTLVATSSHPDTPPTAQTHKDLMHAFELVASIVRLRAAAAHMLLTCQCMLDQQTPRYMKRHVCPRILFAFLKNNENSSDLTDSI